jgi:hypothetical protein
MRLWTKCSWLWAGRVAGSCEHDNEPSGSLKCRVILDRLSDPLLPECVHDALIYLFIYFLIMRDATQCLVKLQVIHGR